MTTRHCRQQNDLDLYVLDIQLRPHRFLFDEITYDMVIDVCDLSDTRVLWPVIERIPQRNRYLFEKGPKLRHSSWSDELHTREQTAHMLYILVCVAVCSRQDEIYQGS